MSETSGIQLILPMAGEGTRFVKAGYKTQKPLLPIYKVPMFQLVLSNLFHNYILKIVVISRREFGVAPLIEKISSNLKVPIELIEIDRTTQGPADTVQLAFEHLSENDPIVIANTDQYLDTDLSFFYETLLSRTSDGVILTMQDNDSKWSYISVNELNYVEEVREKEVISNLATVGIYGFRRKKDLTFAINSMKDRNLRVNGEFYIAPAYNQLIEKGARISYIDLGPISTVMYGLGIPGDYEEFLTKTISRVAAEKALRLTSVN